VPPDTTPRIETCIFAKYNHVVEGINQPRA
jgi:hypothetical protein